MAGLMLLVVAGYAGLGAAAEPQVITPVKVQFTNPTALWANPADGNFNFLENHQIYPLSASADKGQKRLRSWSYVDQVYFPYRPDDPANTLPVVLWADDRSTGQDAGLHLDGLTRQQVAPGGPPAASRTNTCVRSSMCKRGSCQDQGWDLFRGRAEQHGFVMQPADKSPCTSLDQPRAVSFRVWARVR
jgi:hypothetical protein